MSAGDPDYVCSICEAAWSYAEVRHVCCCPGCGGGLVRAAHAHGDGGDHLPECEITRTVGVELATAQPDAKR